MEYHPGPRKTHNLPYSVPHLRFVAVNFAVVAESLVIHKRALVATITGVFSQSRALRAEAGFGAMTFFTVKANHQSDDSFFFFTLFFDSLFHWLRPQLALFQKCIEFLHRCIPSNPNLYYSFIIQPIIPHPYRTATIVNTNNPPDKISDAMITLLWDVIP